MFKRIKSKFKTIFDKIINTIDDPDVIMYIHGLIVFMGTVLIIFAVFFNNNIIDNSYEFIHISDIEFEYKNTSKYVNYMIAENSDDYLFNTIEDYVAETMNDNNLYVVSGIYYKEKTKYIIYEIARIDETTKEIEYLFLDLNSAALYDLKTENKIFKDENMIIKLNEIENDYNILQKNYIIKNNDNYILTIDYIIPIVKNTMDAKSIRNLGVTTNNNELFYKLDINYNNGDSDIVLINARTGDIYK